MTAPSPAELWWRVGWLAGTAVPPSPEPEPAPERGWHAAGRRYLENRMRASLREAGLLVEVERRVPLAVRSSLLEQSIRVGGLCGCGCARDASRHAV